MGAYDIPQTVIDDFTARDVDCIYCRKVMIHKSERKGWTNRWARRADWATIEHLNHLPTAAFQYPKTVEYFGMACHGCNSSRRDKPLAVWVAEKGIADTVAPVVKAYLLRPQASQPMPKPERRRAAPPATGDQLTLSF
jgi:hypothetical protein